MQCCENLGSYLCIKAKIIGDQNKWELNLALNKSITRLLCGESPGSGSVWIAWLKGEVGAHVKVPQPWCKNWHEALGENRFADGNSNTAQDTPFFWEGLWKWWSSQVSTCF